MKRKKTPWVALRMCLTCGHVGCCDSSVGLHATKHFKETGHPVMVALPSKSWKWCYMSMRSIVDVFMARYELGKWNLDELAKNPN